MRLERGSVTVETDQAGYVFVGSGDDRLMLSPDEWRWLVTMAGPALIPREPSPAERLRRRLSRTAPAAGGEVHTVSATFTDPAPPELAPEPPPRMAVLPGLDEDEA